jgi:hypothetical protein
LISYEKKDNQLGIEVRSTKKCLQESA